MWQQRPRARRNRRHVQSGKPDGPAEFVLPPRRPRCPAPRLRGRARLTATRNKGPFDRRIGRWHAVKCESTNQSGPVIDSRKSPSPFGEGNSSQNSFVDEIGLFPGSWGSLTEQVPKSRTKNRTLAKNGVYGGFWKTGKVRGISLRSLPLMLYYCGALLFSVR